MTLQKGVGMGALSGSEALIELVRKERLVHSDQEKHTAWWVATVLDAIEKLGYTLVPEHSNADLLLPDEDDDD